MIVEKPFFAGIVDYNPRRMSEDEAAELNIPVEFIDFVADHRQYPLNISKHFPGGTAWFDSQQPWFFRQIMESQEGVEKLLDSEVLIFSGSGMSARKFSKGEGNFTPEDRASLERSEQLTRDFLGKGKWILGICFGGQIALGAVGAEIGRLPTMSNGEDVTEAGWLDHQLTSEARDDEVFGFLTEQGDTFQAPHFHNDYIAQLPAVGTQVETSSGVITVTKSEVLAIRNGFLGHEGLEDEGTEYTHASVVIFDNGARLYQIQPHPEMASADKADFLVRKNAWLANEMGEEYFEQALIVPEGADYSVAQVITSFTSEAKKHLEEQHGQVFADSVVANNLHDYLLP